MAQELGRECVKPSQADEPWEPWGPIRPVVARPIRRPIKARHGNVRRDTSRPRGTEMRNRK